MAATDKSSLVSDFLSFLNASPTAFHAVDESKRRLLKAGYQQVSERDDWKLEAGKKYFFTRNYSTIVAFAIGQKYVAGNGFHIIGAHTDSPCLKLKPVSKVPFRFLDFHSSLLLAFPLSFQTPQNPNSRSITESNSCFSQDGSSSSSPSSSELSSFFNIHPQPLMNLEDPTAHNHHQLDPLDVLVMGKAFPETGKLLKAVVEAGPLLQTLLVAGPLPKWINPPPQTQAQRFELPPISFRGSDVKSSSSASGLCDSLTCSDSVKRFGFDSSSVMDRSMLTGKRQRLE